MGGGARIRNGAYYRRVAREVATSGRPCAKCGEPIDLALTKRAAMRYLPGTREPNPEWNHRMAGTAGHIRPVAVMESLGLGHLANEPSNLQPEHRRCNSGEGNAIARMMRTRPTSERTWSRDW